MSPSSSTLPSTSRAPGAKTHSRRTSTTNTTTTTTTTTNVALATQAPLPSTRSSKPPTPGPPSENSKPRPIHHTVIIRCPFARGSFTDPAPVDWTATKDRALWKLISSASTAKDLDWAVVAESFDVEVAFLVQQAAWLYERHFEGMRKGMARLGGGIKGGEESKVALPSAIDTQQQRSLPNTTTATADSGSAPPTPRSSKPLLSRNPSATTVTQSGVQAPSPRQGSLRAFRGSSGSQRRPPPPVRNVESSLDAGSNEESALGGDGASDSDSVSEDEGKPSGLGRSSKVARRPTFGRKQAVSDSDGDVEDDDGVSSGDGYLPFAAAASSKATARDDPAATLRSSPKRQTATPHVPAASSSSKLRATRAPALESSASSASSAHPTHFYSTGPLSPAQRALSPRHKPKAKAQPPSEPSGTGTASPSTMGSSFSDLDEFSGTQSALEEAVMSTMQRGGGSSLGIGMGSMGSRLSGGGK